MKKKSCTNSSLPALILTFALLIFWQAAAMGVNAAYILPSPIQILQKLWELREPLFMAHLPATMSVVAIGLGISIVLGLGLALGIFLGTCIWWGFITVMIGFLEIALQIMCSGE